MNIGGGLPIALGCWCCLEWSFEVVIAGLRFLGWRRESRRTLLDHDMTR